jgi:hypothetical protein
LQALLDKIIARLMTMLTRQGYLIEEQGMTYLADIDADNPLKTLQARLIHLSHRLGSTRRTKGAEPANRVRPRQEMHASAVRRWPGLECFQRLQHAFVFSL